MASRNTPLTALTLVVALVVAGPRASAEPTSSELTFRNRRAQGHYDNATRFFADGRLEAAEQELGLAYAIEPLPALLLLRLRILDMLGRCAEGMPLADEYLASGPDEAGREMVEALVAECRRRSGSAPKEPPAAEETTSSPAPAGPHEPDAEAPPRSWRRDPLGGALVGAGAALLAAGVALEVSSLGEIRRAEESELHDDYADHRRRTHIVQGVGGASLAVGAALVIGGVLRYRALRRRGAEATPTTWVSPDGAGIGLIARF